MFAGSGSALAGKTAPVEIGFQGVPPVGFQNVLLNVQAVRINPKANAAPDDPNWQKIGVPPGISGGGIGTPELQIDLNNSQDLPQLFNIAKVKPGKYKIAQLILDPNNPGTLVPVCPSAGTPEGCINYPFQLTNAGSPINLISASPPLIDTSKAALSQLIIKLTMKIDTPPVAPGGSYLVSFTMDPVPSALLGSVSGTVPGGSGITAKHLRKLSVTAELIGTNTEIAVAPVSNGGFGTLYDLALSGGGDSYGAIRLAPLIPLSTLDTEDFKGVLTNQTLGSISGTVMDFCVAKKPIAGATIQLLIPPLNNLKLSDGSGDCSKPANLGECVSVATANTDNTGSFPLPGTLTLPSAFASVPVLKSGTYTMMVTAPGYDPSFTPVNSTSGTKAGGNCSTSKTITPCKILLTSGTITGTIPIVAPVPGQTALVQVFAEDAGTNNIVSALPMPIIARPGSNAVGFTINVPTSATGKPFDLFATTIDLFQGIADPYQGHSIVVIPNVPGPTTPSGPGACFDKTPPNPPTEAITCVGHGSMTGTVGNANLGESVVLSIDDVKITNTAVQNQFGNGSPNPTNSFSFCVPGGDTYTVQAFQLPTPVAGVTPLIAPTPAPAEPTAIATVTIPQAPSVGGPSPTPTPAFKCPTTCSSAPGVCPGICKNASQVVLP